MYHRNPEAAVMNGLQFQLNREQNLDTGDYKDKSELLSDYRDALEFTKRQARNIQKRYNEKTGFKYREEPDTDYERDSNLRYWLKDRLLGRTLESKHELKFSEERRRELTEITDGKRFEGVMRDILESYYDEVYLTSDFGDVVGGVDIICINDNPATGEGIEEIKFFDIKSEPQPNRQLKKASIEDIAESKKDDPEISSGFWKRCLGSGEIQIFATPSNFYRYFTNLYFRAIKNGNYAPNPQEIFDKTWEVIDELNISLPSNFPRSFDKWIRPVAEITTQ